MSRKRTVLWILLITLVVGLNACDQIGGSGTGDETAATPPPAEPTQAATETASIVEPRIEPAEIESLEVITQDLASGLVSVRLRGLLANDCAGISDIASDSQGTDFKLTVLSVVEPGENCSAEAVPFEEIVDLDVAGLQPGSYTVTANERQVSFELANDELEPTVEPEPTEEAAEAAPTAESPAGAISGVVWHDSCANVDVADTALPEGCLLTADNVFLADGVLDGNEEGIAGVEVALGEGTCPASEPLETVLTGEDGAFTFGELLPGNYCLFIDMTRTQNQGILGGGSWTVPADSPESAISLAAGETLEDQNFGWDFLDLPLAADVNLTDCTNSFEFVADLNIPDDSPFASGEEFTKEWQLRNNGTCPWSTEYSIVFVGGDLMSAEESIPLEQVVAPGEELTVAIDMVAPVELGTYRGNWQVADANGQPFGIDGFIEDAFWLQIAVVEDAEAEAVATAGPNSAALGGVVWEDFCINSDPGQGCVESPIEAGVFIGDGTFGAIDTPLSGILIGLAGEACAADGTFPAGSALLDTTLTGDDGQYLFEDLAEGTYCVFMDALNQATLDLLIPGNWTWPGTGVGQYTVVLDPGEQRLDLDFGWDYIE